MMTRFLRERKGYCTEPFSYWPEAFTFASMRYIMIIITISLFSSCIALQAPEVKSVSNIQTSGLLSAHPHLALEVVMYNPNSMSVGLSDFNLEVMYGSLSLATLELDTLQTVAAESNFTVPLNFSPTTEQINNILQSGLGIFNQGSAAKLTGKGSVKVHKYLFGKTFRFSF